MLRAGLTAAVVWALIVGAQGCKKAPEKSIAKVAGPQTIRRNPHGEKKRGRFGLAWIKDDRPFYATKGSEQSETEHSENDGGKAVAPPPRPDPKTLPSERSFSVGAPNGGWLMGGRAMPLKSPYFSVLPGTARRGWNFGGEELVALLDHGARTVAEKFPGAVLRVGNMSRKEGGKIAPSVSHQSGRDADIGLYCTDLDNQPVNPPGFPKFHPKGGAIQDTSGQYLFDTERNWTFVAALLSDKKARVQWIFLDTPLKYAMLDFAVQKGAPAELVDKAEKVIVRPENSSPHAEHFHVRIFCTARDQSFGCKDYGPEWKWIKKERAKNEERIQKLVDRIMAGEKGLLPMDGDSSKPLKDLPRLDTPQPAPLNRPKSKGRTPKYERGNLPTDVKIEL